MDTNQPIRAGLLLSGGVALGAFQAGVISALCASGRLQFEAVGGSSIGAYGAAIFAGNLPERRAERLLEFWHRVSKDSLMAGSLAPWPHPRAEYARSWVHAMAARTQGVAGFFRPFPRLGSEGGGPGLYDSSIADRTLREMVDFEQLNSGETRCCIAATDVESGAPVWFDTALGAHISPDVVRGSGSLIPAFPPVRVAERLLVDGGLSANIPLEPFLAATRPVPASPVVVVIDLFSPAGESPGTLESSHERANDIMYGAQTRLRLEGLVRERALEARINPDAPGTDLLLLTYRTGPEEAGPEKPFDFSRAAIARRLAAGEAAAHAALACLDALPSTGAPGLRVHEVDTFSLARAGTRAMASG